MKATFIPTPNFNRSFLKKCIVSSSVYYDTVSSDMPKKVLHLYVFLTGAAILALEISASRLMAPYFGTSLFVWGNILGVVLSALALGYYYGGKLADSHPNTETLGLITWIAGVIIAFIPLVSPFILKSITAFLSGMPAFIIAASFIGMLILFAIPLTLLGALTPLATRIAVREIHEVGSVSGSLSAASTAGSILGAFIPSFVLIPFYGTRFTILISAIVLIVIGTFAIGRRRFIFGLMLPIVLFQATPSALSSSTILYAQESPYQFIRVVKEHDKNLLLVNEGAGVQSISLNEKGLTESYTDILATLPTFFPATHSLEILVIGVAGGSLITQIQQHYPDRELHIDAVEIDGAMFTVAENYFDLQKEDAVQIIMDGRRFLQKTKKKYDIIFVDAYREELYVPFHLTTKEFFSLISERLTPTGIFAMNVLGEDAGGLLLYLEETARAIFPIVTSSHLPHTLNNVVLANFEQLQWERLAEAPQHLQLAAHTLKNFREVIPGNHILTDDRAPVEYLTDKMLLTFILSRRK